MLGNSPDQHQLNLLEPTLPYMVRKDDIFVLLAKAIPWKDIQDKFQDLYSSRGAPSHPIRKMVGLLLLQHMHQLSDESAVETWKHNIYWQYFCGEVLHTTQQPCAASDLVHFRKRIGKEGVDYLFSISVQLHKTKIAKAKEVIVDTTVQESNVTFPTDAKLYKKVIERCNAIAKKSKVTLRQSYRFVTQSLFYLQRYAHIPQHAKKAKSALRRLRTIAGRQVRDLVRKLTVVNKVDVYASVIAIMERIVEQKRTDKGKVYSLHAPEVSCIAKGKVHKKYEFGSKVSIATLPGSNVVVGIETFQGNPHDSKTLLPALERIKDMFDKTFSRVLVDRGYRGCKEVCGSEVILPGGCKSEKPYEQRRHKLRCRRRSAVEAVIGHLKSDHKLGLNCLKGTVGAEMNALLSGIGFNLKLLMREISHCVYDCVTVLVTRVEKLLGWRLEPCW